VSQRKSACPDGDRRHPDFLHAALDTTACAAFFKESRMKCAEAASCTGNPGLGFLFADAFDEGL